MPTTDILRPYGTKNAWTWEPVPTNVHMPDEIAPGVTDHPLWEMEAGMHVVDEHIDKLMVTLENAPGAGKTVTVTVSNGVDTITVTISEGNTSGSSTTNNFDWDVSAQNLLVKYTTTAGTATGHITVHVQGHEVVIT